MMCRRSIFQCHHSKRIIEIGDTEEPCPVWSRPTGGGTAARRPRPGFPVGINQNSGSAPKVASGIGIAAVYWNSPKASAVVKYNRALRRSFQTKVKELSAMIVFQDTRSEERRVGKECR